MSPPSWFCSQVSLSSMKMSSMVELVMEVDPEELTGSVKLWGGKETPEKSGRGWEDFPSSDDDKKTAMGLI